MLKIKRLISLLLSFTLIFGVIAIIPAYEEKQPDGDLKSAFSKAVYTYNESLSVNKFKNLESGKVFTIQNVGVPGGAYISKVEITFADSVKDFILTYTKADGSKAAKSSKTDGSVKGLVTAIDLNDYISSSNVNLLLKNLGPGSAKIASVVVYYKTGASDEVNFADAPYDWENVVIGGGGGFIPRVVYSPLEAGVSYVGTDMGGLYRKKPGENRYVPVTDWVQGVKIQGVESIAADPVKPGRVYAALGTYMIEELGPSVIARSDDYGDTWSQIVEMPFNMGGNMPGRGAGERLAIDPNDPNVIYFGARGGYGLWRSEDAGLTWGRVERFPNVGAMNASWSETATIDDAVGVLWIAFDTAHGTVSGKPTQKIYVGCADGDLEDGAYRKGSCIYVSEDGGETWAAVPGQVKSTDIKEGNRNIFPSHGLISGDYLYITYMIEVGPYSGSEGAVWKLNLSTGEWKDITPEGSLTAAAPFSTREIGFGGLAADAQNPGVIMVSTLNLWWPDEQILRSLDGGETWSPIITFNDSGDTRINKYRIYYNDPQYPESDARWLDWANPTDQTLVWTEVQPKMGWMIHALAIDPFDSNTFCWGTGATLYGTNELYKWDNWSGVDSSKMTVNVYGMGIEECAVLGMISPTDGVHLISGVGDIYGFVHEDFSKSNDMIRPDGNMWALSMFDYAALSPNIIVAGCENDGKAYAAVSKDYGKTWAALEEAQDSAEAFYGSIAVNADGSKLILAPGKGSACYMDLTAKTPQWAQVTGISGRARLASDRVDPDTVYGYSEGKAYRSVDGGKTFALVNDNALLPRSEASCFVTAPGREGHIWLAGSNNANANGSDPNGLWRSTDGGATFTRVNPSVLTDVTAVGLGKAEASSDYETLFIQATINNVWGIYMSTDQGVSWVRINDDLHQFANVKWSFIEGDMRIFGRVYIGVDGRGVIMGNPKVKSGANAVTDDYTNGGYNTFVS